MKPFSPLAFLMWFLLWVFVLHFVLGCQHTPRPINDPTSQLAEHVTGAKGEVVAAKADLHAKAYDSADKHLDGAVVHLDAETKVIATVASDSIKTQERLNAVQAQIDAHRNDWFGPRAHRWFWGLLITGLLLSVGLGLLRGFLPASGIAQVASHFVIGVFSFGAGWVHAAAKWLGSKLHKPATG